MKEKKINLFFYKIYAVIPGWTPIWKGTKCAPNNAPIDSCNICDALIVFQNIINNGFKLAVVISLIMIAYGAIYLMTSGGSQDKIKTGKNIINSALIGLILALLSWTIVNLLLHLLTGVPNLPWHRIKC